LSNYTFYLFHLLKQTKFVKQIIFLRKMFACTDVVCELFWYTRLSGGWTDLALRPDTGLFFLS